MREGGGVCRLKKELISSSVFTEHFGYPEEHSSHPKLAHVACGVAFISGSV